MANRGKKLIDMQGMRFGRLVVLRRDGTKGKAATWECLCDCGNHCVTAGGSLRKGRSVSCGCWKREGYGGACRTHADTHSPEHNTWSKIIGRCKNKNDNAYHRYGGRGITVCDRWLKYENFLSDMGRRPSDAHSIDRIDNNGCYEPNNCRWATAAEQSRNRRSNVFVEVDGYKMVLKDAADKFGIPYKTVHARISNGWEIMDALTRPLR